MTSHILLAMLQIACVLLILWFFFIKIVENRKSVHSRDNAPLPKTALIVPVTGAQQGLQTNLLSLLQQEHPDYLVYFVTKDKKDAAAPIISRLLKENRHARLIHSGESHSCSQKNHNIIIGSDAAAEAKILVFCDSGHRADPHWLARLITPLINKKTNIISSGYHQVNVNGLRLTETGRAICVLVLRLARMIPGFEQPWGGATAITMETFQRIGIKEMWSTRVVDDVTLADHLHKNGFSTFIPGKSDLYTELHDMSWKGWETWLTRQWAYLKFVFPRLWFFLGLSGIFFTLALYFCTFTIALAPFGLISQSIHSQANTAMALFLIFGLLLRTAHPKPGSLFVWFPALYSALILAGWCHARTWFTDSITWAGITYEVTEGGRVSKIYPQKY